MLNIKQVLISGSVTVRKRKEIGLGISGEKKGKKTCYGASQDCQKSSEKDRRPFFFVRKGRNLILQFRLLSHPALTGFPNRTENFCF